MTCPCGCSVQKSEFPRHQRSKKHLSYIEKNKNNLLAAKQLIQNQNIIIEDLRNRISILEAK